MTTTFADEPRKADPRRWASGTDSLFDRVISYGPYNLLKIPEIRSELKLSNAQAKAIDEAWTNRTMEHSRFVSELGGEVVETTPRERFLTGIGQLLGETRRRRHADIAPILQVEQRRRFTGLVVQFLGPFSVTTPEVQQALNIDPDRAEEIDSIVTDYQLSLRDLTAALDARTKALEKKYPPFYSSAAIRSFNQQPEVVALYDAHEVQAQALLDRTNRGILRLLTRRQRERLDKLRGEPFEPIRRMLEPDGVDLLQSKDKRPAPRPAMAEPDRKGVVPQRSMSTSGSR